MEIDLFTYVPSAYPEAPGYKDDDTSAAAAETVDGNFLRRLCLSALAEHGPLTADECSEHCELSVLSIRPRFSELRHLGKIEDTGERRPNISGRLAKVWKLV